MREALGAQGSPPPADGLGQVLESNLSVGSVLLLLSSAIEVRGGRRGGGRLRILLPILIVFPVLFLGRFFFIEVARGGGYVVEDLSALIL